MSTSVFLAKAPSNIALAKYMGKVDPAQNLPANASLSMTLDRLCTFAEVKKTESSGLSFRWNGGVPSVSAEETGLPPAVPSLSEKGIERMTRHLERVFRLLPELFSRHGLQRVESASFEASAANTFPAASGIASSASSFAAMTLAMAAASVKELDRFRALYQDSSPFREALSVISRQGSGSSCRSFDGPWVFWERDSGRVIESKLPPLVDLVLLVQGLPKKISSSEAHALVRTSPLWHGRPERAGQRANDLRLAIAAGDLAKTAQLSWQEFWEMHSLFHTAEAPFTYWEPESLGLLKWFLAQDRSAAIVTMDAGPNIHLLVPENEANRWKTALREKFPSLTILEDRQGMGARLLKAGSSNA